MPPLSDILILFDTALDEVSMARAKTCLMTVDGSVLIHQKEDQSRVLLVKFDPLGVTPSVLLTSLWNAGFKAKMAGG